MITLKVEAMTCGHCVRTITRATQTLDPDARVEADIATRLVRIASTRSRDELVRTLADTGYPATAV